MDPAIKTSIGIYELEAPRIEGMAFVGRSGWLGARCGCGFVASARSLVALHQGLAEHQEPETCPYWAQVRKEEDEAEA